METSQFKGHTPGEWRVGDAGHTVFGPNLGKPSPEIIASVQKRANAALIAHTPDLLAEVERLRAEVAELREAASEALGLLEGVEAATRGKMEAAIPAMMGQPRAKAALSTLRAALARKGE